MKVFVVLSILIGQLFSVLLCAEETHPKFISDGTGGGQCENSQRKLNYFGDCGDLRGFDVTKQDNEDLDYRNYSLKGADFTGATFNDSTDFRGSEFNAAIFNGARFYGADFRGADFRKAKLRGVKFSGADMSATLLCDTDLSGANTVGADFSAAVYDEKTIFPDSFSDGVAHVRGMTKLTSIECGKIKRLVSESDY